MDCSSDVQIKRYSKNAESSKGAVTCALAWGFVLSQRNSLPYLSFFLFGFLIMEKLVSAGEKKITCSRMLHCRVNASCDLRLLVVWE